MDTVSIRRAKAIVFVAIVALMAAACGGQGHHSSGDADGGTQTVTSFSEHVECGEVVKGQLEASESITDKFGIAGYRYEFDKKTPARRIELLDERENTIGRLITRVDSIEANPLRAKITHEYRKDGELEIRKTVEASRFRTGEAWLVADYEADRQVFRHWFSYDKDLKLQQVVVGKPASEGDSRPSVGSRQDRPSGLYDVVHANVENEGLDNAEKIRNWSSEVGLKPLIDSTAHDIFQQAESDKKLNRGLGRHLVKCEGASAGKAVRRRDQLQSREQKLERNQRVCVGNLSSRDRKVLSSTANAMSTIDTGTDVGKVLIAGGAAGGPVTAVAAIGGGYLAGAAADKLAGPLLEAGMRGSGKDDAADFIFGSSSGDPHLTTIDGMTYDFQAAGEFILVESLDGNFEIQIREQPVDGAKCANVTFNTAVATKINETRVGVYARRDNTVYVDGEPIAFQNGFLQLDGGGRIKASGGKEYTVYWPDGNRFKVKVRGNRLDIYAGLGETTSQSVHGLLGRPNGRTEDDFSLRDGTVIGDSIEWNRLYGEYADSWRIDPSESLFDYAEGKSSQDYQRPEIPTRPASVEGLPDSEVESARTECEEAGLTDERIIKDCTVDIACTGNSSYLQSHADRREPETSAVVEEPIFLDNWSKEGPPDNGNWDVAEDGRSVTQTNNGEPTFFVSRKEYRGTTLTGTIEVNAADNDYVGFVFGYQGPIEGESTETDMYMLGWRKGANDAQKEGLVLSRVTEIDSDSFWASEDTENFEVIARKQGKQTGWDRGAVHDFTLSYSADRLQIAIDGDLIFDIPASRVEPEEFQTGRFGFYNYSQRGVTYGNFEDEGQFRDLTELKRQVEGEFEFTSPRPALGEGKLEAENGYIIEESRGRKIDKELIFEHMYSGSYYGGVEGVRSQKREQMNCSSIPGDVALNSYIIHYDPPSGDRIVGSVQLDEPIVGIISSKSGLEATDELFGIDGVTYPSEGARGLDGDQDGFVFDRQSNRLDLSFRVRGVIDELRVVTLANRPAESKQQGAYPRSCSDVPAAERSDGTYTIDPDGSGGTPPFATYCRFEQQRAWTMASKISDGASETGKCLWMLGALNADTEDSKLDPGVKANYGNRLVHQYWNQNGFELDSVKVVVYSGGQPVKEIEFSANGTSQTSWFSPQNVVSSPWTDLTSEPHNIFSITGELRDDHRRDFFINRNYGGCPNDRGWLIADSGDWCEWNKRGNGAGSIDIRYADATTVQNWTTGSIGRADTMVIYVSHKTQ